MSSETSEQNEPMEQPSDVLIGLRDKITQRYCLIDFFPYQRECSDEIIRSLANNEGKEIYIEFSRQSGKTTLIAYTAYSLALTYYMVTGKPILIGIFAPGYGQAYITFKKMREAFNPIELENNNIQFAVNNGDTIVLTDKATRNKIAEVMSITASPECFIKGHTFDLIICEEAQDIRDVKIKEDILPMGSATNATKVYIGTPALGTHQKFFYEGLINDAPKRVKFINDCQTAIKFNPRYKEYVDDVISRIGADSEEFRSQYLLEWVLETSKFVVPKKLYELRKDYESLSVKMNTKV